MTVHQELDQISRAENLTEAQGKSIASAASYIRSLEDQVKELEERMRGMRTIEEVHQIIAAKEAGMEVAIDYYDPDAPQNDGYVYHPCW